MIDAVEAIRQRTLRAAAALRDADVPYAVVGGNAVAAWVARVDRAAVRNTQDVDILIRRSDFHRGRLALEATGFIYQEITGIDCFLDGPDSGPRDAIHIVYAAEKVKPEHIGPAADLDQVERGEGFDVIPLEALVRMKLNSFRRKDQVHLLDMLAVGLIDESWTPRLGKAHAARLQQLIDDPEG